MPAFARARVRRPILPAVLLVLSAPALLGTCAAADTDPRSYCTLSPAGVGTILRSEAHASADAVGSVGDGQALRLVERRADDQGDPWIRVEADGAAGWLPAEAAICRLPPDAARAAVTEPAGRAIAALRDRDFAALAALAHPDLGIRFSPSGYIETEDDVVVPADRVATLWSDPTERVWGYEAGTGDAIRTTFAGYYRRHVYDRPYADADEIAFNRLLGTTNSAENVFDVYPQAAVAEFWLKPGQPDGQDWSSLRLIFVPWGAEWRLAGISRAAWSP